VKRRRGHRPCNLLAEQVGQPQAQLAGGADAERDREDLSRPRPPGREQVRGSVGQRSCLAGTGPGEQ
jgi:hypothetical protein